MKTLTVTSKLFFLWRLSFSCPGPSRTITNRFNSTHTCRNRLTGFFLTDVFGMSQLCAEEVLLEQLQRYSGYNIPSHIQCMKSKLKSAGRKASDQPLMYVTEGFTKLTQAELSMMWHSNRTVGCQ
jgi:hypothetical protein